jgi:hypothetical protein
MREPFEALDQQARAQESKSSDEDERGVRSESPQPTTTLKHAALTAAVGALTAGLAGAAKAWLERRGSDSDGSAARDHADEGDPSSSAEQTRDRSDEPRDAAPSRADAGIDSPPANEGEVQARADEPSRTDPESHDGEDEETTSADAVGSASPEAERAEPEAEQAEREQTAEAGDGGEDEETTSPDAVGSASPEAEQAEREQTVEAGHGGEDAEQAAEADQRVDGDADIGDEAQKQEEGRHDDRPRGAPAGEASKIVEQARMQLERLFLVEAESVSGLGRSNGQWSVTLEVVELHRIPESTDVLASYEVVLDEDGNLVRVDRTRRYRRSHVEQQ